MKYQDDSYYIDRIRNGEVAAFASLVEKHKDMVFSIALKILNNREDAEEAAQDAFVKAYQSLPGFEGKSRFSTWLYRIIYNTSVSRVRKKKMEFVAMNESVIQNYTETELTEQVDRLDEEEQGALIERALKQLPEEDQVLITLFYRSENSVEEISYITGLTQSNVKVRLHRIRKKLYDGISVLMNAEMV